MKKTIRDIDVRGKNVFVRCDFNVPIENGKITDDKRIIESLPTIHYLISQDAKIVLCSHLGRPKGKISKAFSLKPVADRLSELLGKEVPLATDVIGEDAKHKHAELKEGDVMLLENIRFCKGEEENDPAFAKTLSEFGEIYVNDAFGAAHRAHASTEGIARYIPAVAGLLLEKEIQYLTSALENIERPYTAILGGAKVSDKILLIESLFERVDSLIIGGGMAFTFIKAKGGNIGKSLLEENMVELAGRLMEKAKYKGVKLLLPVDVKVTTEFSNETPVEQVDIMEIPDNMFGLDIGEKTIELFTNEIMVSKTVVWNGPMGVFELPHFEMGTKKMAQAMAECSGKTIIGGGDSAAAVNKFGLTSKMLHVSTGGGASLEFLEGKTLPGVACLDEKLRRNFIAGNWKMYKTNKEAFAFMRKFSSLYEEGSVEVGLMVPYLQIEKVKELASYLGVKVGAQNVHSEEYGAYTGEVSAPMLQEIGIDYCIVGHSERRQYFQETDEIVNKKARKTFEHGMIPIICVGESLEEREKGEEKEIVQNQVKAALQDLTDAQAKEVVIAYEPVWAIGTGKSATAKDANDMCGHIRQTVAECYNAQIADGIRILYGGSVKGSNASEIMKQQDVDGALVGGASLDPEEFVEIINF